MKLSFRTTLMMLATQSMASAIAQSTDIPFGQAYAQDNSPKKKPFTLKPVDSSKAQWKQEQRYKRKA